MKYVWIAAVLGLALGVGIGPIVAACVDTIQVSPLTEPSVFLRTVATKLRAFQARVSELRACDLVAAVTPASLR